MSQTFFAILTAIGEAKHQNAALLGQKVQYAQMAVGDGNGSVPMPGRDQKKLVNQVNIAPINQAFIDPANKSQIVIEQVIPEIVGGWWIREAGIFDVAGDLIAVANVPPTYKPQMAEGSGRTQVIRIVLLLTDVSVVSLKIDPAVVLATRQYADELFNRPSGVEVGRYGSKSAYPIIEVNERGVVTYVSQIETVSVWDSIPEKNIGDIIFVKGLGEMWWTESAFFTGYRTKYCGFPIQSLDRVDRSFTLALDGGFFDKTKPKYRGLYGWVLENNLMVPAADYKDKEGFFCEAGGNMVKTPNQLDVFWRNIGTDADTANARALGSVQSDALRRHSHMVNFRTNGDASSGEIHDVLKTGGGYQQPTTADGGPETRPINTALHPRVQI
ncbi:phage tail protein [Alcaligenes nematophilus]